MNRDAAFVLNLFAKFLAFDCFGSQRPVQTDWKTQHDGLNRFFHNDPFQMLDELRAVGIWKKREGLDGESQGICEGEPDSFGPKINGQDSVDGFSV